VPVVKAGLRVAALIAICAVAFVLDVALMHAMTSLLHMNDFGKFYYSAQAFLDGGDMYAPNPATNLRFVEAPELQFLNMNPPHFHLLVLPLARLPPDVAVTVWLAVSLMALIVSVLIISREFEVVWTAAGVLTAAAGALAFAGTQSFFATGNLSLLLLLALTICWAAARRGNWTMAAVWLGACLSVKPFLLIFAPYLLLTRRFRPLVVALAAAVSCLAAGLLIFGADAYRAWYGALARSGDWAWGVMNASFLGIFRRAFDSQPIGTPLVIAPALVKGWLVAAAIVGVVTLVACLPDARSSTASTGSGQTGSGRAEDVDRSFALLLVAAQLVSPLGWIYYLWLPAGPIAAVALKLRNREVAQAFRPADAALKRCTTFRHLLALIAAIGFVWPMPFLLAFRNHAWGTLTIASIYFWATLALWLWLLANGAHRSRG
jgi:hypothetical protein